MVGYEESLQAAGNFLVFAFCMRLDAELAWRSSESRYFDHISTV
jgi:hypothetical protein